MNSYKVCCWYFLLVSHWWRKGEIMAFRSKSLWVGVTVATVFSAVAMSAPGASAREADPPSGDTYVLNVNSPHDNRVLNVKGNGNYVVGRDSSLSGTGNVVASTVNGDTPGTGATTSKSFQCTQTGDQSPFAVPAGVHQLTVTAVGAQGTAGEDGAEAGSDGGSGGFGAVVTATVPVTPNESLTVVAGCQWPAFTANGLGAGGVRGRSDSSNSGDGGYGGGGSGVLASDLSTLVIAGGGGGGGGGGAEGSGGHGGAGGRTAQDGANGGGGTYGGDGGIAGASPSEDGENGEGSSLGGGGGGGGGGCSGGGGGGGGNSFPSLGAGAGGGGGAGFSCVTQSATQSSIVTGNQAGNGTVTITWSAPAAS